MSRLCPLPLRFLITQYLLLPACVSIFILTSRPLSGQDSSERQRASDRKAAVAETNEFMDKIRPILFGNLPADEMAIYRKIDFRVTNLEATWKAASGKEDGDRFVELDEGVARQMEILAAAQIIEQMQNRDVLIPYLRYVAQAMNNKATFIKDVTVFAHVDPDEIDGNPTRHRAQLAMVLNGMAFLLAHEVGHHILGHYDRTRTTDLSTLRQMELDADAWAIKRCLSANPHFSPLGGVLPLLFEYYTTPHPISRETTADHPAAVRRIHALYEAMQSALPEFRDEIIQQGASYQDFKEYVSRTAANYERQIENNDTPVQELPSTQSHVRSRDSESDDIDEDERSTSRRPRLGRFCGDVYGNRYCPMIRPMQLGSACTCSNLPGWGVVVP